MSKNVAEYFACDVFNDEVMKARLPKAVYKALTKTRKLGVPLDPTYADVVANALKDWAIEHGLSLIHISEPTRQRCVSRMPSSA